jgi:Fe-S cluster assembly ATP-binding protein
MLSIKNLKVKVEDKLILNGVELTIEDGSTHALMGQNGSGKSTLAQTLMGNPTYTIVSGEVLFDGNKLLDMEPGARAKLGLFLSFQHPSEVDGVAVGSYLRMIYNTRTGAHLSPVGFRKLIADKLALLEMKEDVLSRSLNFGFSGGEKKRMEMLQMLVLEPKLAILDEVDSGLDVDALKIVAKSVNYLKAKNNMAVLIITHYARVLRYIEPNFVHIMQAGVITQSGDSQLARVLEEKGYAGIGGKQNI